MKKLLLFAGLLLLPFAAEAQAPAQVNGCQYNGTPPALTDKQTVVFQCDTTGALIVAGFGGGTLSMDLASINGVAPVDVGVGTGGSATLRVAIDTAQTLTAGTAGTPSSAVLSVQGLTSMTPLLQGTLQTGAGGTARSVKTCDLVANIDNSTSGSVTAITGVASRQIYICGYILATGGTATNLKLVQGSNANCAADPADLTPAWQLVANDKIGAYSAVWGGMKTSADAYYVCVNASAGNSHQAQIWYTTQ